MKNSLLEKRFLSFSELSELLQRADEKDICIFIQQTLHYKKKISYRDIIIQQDYPEDLLEFIFEHSEVPVQNKLKKSLITLINDLIDNENLADQDDLDMFRNCLILLKLFRVEEAGVFKKLLELASNGRMRGKYSYDKREMHTELLRTLFYYVYHMCNNKDVKEKILSLAEENLEDSSYAFVSLRLLWEVNDKSKVNEARIKYINTIAKSFANIDENKKKTEYKDQLAATLRYLFYISNFSEEDIALFVSRILSQGYIDPEFMREVLHRMGLSFISAKGNTTLSNSGLGLIDRSARGYHSVNSPQNSNLTTNRVWKWYGSVFFFMGNSGKVKRILHIFEEDNRLKILTSKELTKSFKEEGLSDEDINKTIFHILTRKSVQNDPVLKKYSEIIKYQNNRNRENNGYKILRDIKRLILETGLEAG